jgi:hypothetical protein
MTPELKSHNCSWPGVVRSASRRLLAIRSAVGRPDIHLLAPGLRGHRRYGGRMQQEVIAMMWSG